MKERKTYWPLGGHSAQQAVVQRSIQFSHQLTYLRLMTSYNIRPRGQKRQVTQLPYTKQ